MIPIRLRVRNFLSYGEEVDPLDFTSFTIACLTGRNGHGKSALLDAMTWAVWGEARKAGYSRTPDADLIRLNADEMSVEFIFFLNDREYQVQREYRRKGSKSKLEFRVRAHPETEYRVLTGNSKNETQRRIIETLSLDYRTFINSSFLQQGKADEFTRQKPAERKEILANILGLSYYDRLLEEAKQRWSISRAESRNLEESLAQIDQELEEESRLLEKSKELNRKIEEKDQTIRKQREQEKELQDKITELRLIQERYQRSENEIRSLKKRKTEHLEWLNKEERERIDLKKYISRTEEIQNQYQRYGQIVQELNRLLEVESEYRNLEQTIKAVEQQIENQRNRIQEELHFHSVEFAKLQVLTGKIDTLQKDIEKSQKNISQLPQLEPELDNQRKELKKIEEAGITARGIIDQAKREIERYKQGIGENHEKLLLLQRSKTPECPLCKSSLDEAGRNELLMLILKEIKDAELEITNWEKSSATAAQKRDMLLKNYTACSKQISAKESECTRILLEQQTLNSRELELSSLLKMQIQMKEIEGKIQQVKTILTTENYAAQERTQLGSLRESMKPLEREIAKRKKLHEEQQVLRNAPVEWSLLEQARIRLPQLDNDMRDHQIQMEELQNQIQIQEKETQQIFPQLTLLAETENQIKPMENLRFALERERDELNQQQGGMLQQIARLEKQKLERREKKEKLATVQQDEHLYEILKNAFSRNGIPAMIVEQALPELEEDANRLLRRLTNGSCSVKLISQREAKSGGTIETLDIKISDEIGTRDYEMFSGGEAFRTDIALRIALSQLLCRRAGSRLQLLVIDEGFGTQDTEGLNNIIEAIHDIQDEFEKILVVTHLEELKEKFLVRIEVTKEPGIGSRYEVIHSL